MDIRKDIEDIRFVASLTDSTIRGYESAPYLPDAILTADKRVTGELLRHLPVGWGNAGERAQGKWTPLVAIVLNIAAFSQ